MTGSVWLGGQYNDGLGLDRFVCYLVRMVGRNLGVAAPPGELNLPNRSNGIAFTCIDETATSLSQRPTIQHRRLMWKSHA